MKTPTVLHLFCDLGGGALGFKRAGFRSVGNVDCDPGAIADIEYLTGESGTVADLGTLTPQELRELCGERPDVVFTSPPCKGFSGCLAGERTGNDHYQGLNSLSMRGVWIALEAWADSPPPLIVFENVPRIAARGAKYIKQVEGLLRGYGYAVHHSTHNCAELGGLAQNRHRYLLVARHMQQVPEFLRVPHPKRPRSVGDVLGSLPVPDEAGAAGGDMHRLPKMAAVNWLRLQQIPAGLDWRQLEGELALPARAGRQNGGFGVNRWTEPSHTVVAEGTVRNTWASVADPRAHGVQLGLLDSSAGDLDVSSKRPIHARLRAADGTWHRPMTTLEMAVLQGFPAKLRGEWLRFTGRSHKAWRGRIGNAVPPPTAEAIARSCMKTLVASATGEAITSGAVWVAPRVEGEVRACQ